MSTHEVNKSFEDSEGKQMGKCFHPPPPTHTHTHTHTNVDKRYIVGYYLNCGVFYVNVLYTLWVAFTIAPLFGTV